MIQKAHHAGKNAWRVFVSLTALMVAPAPIMHAHHSFAAEYEARLIKLKGTITRFEWMNPHTRVYLDVTDVNGAVTKWECEGSAPGGLVSNGWNRESLQPGDVVTIEGYPAKTGAHVCKVRDVTLANGRRLTMGSSSGPG